MMNLHYITLCLLFSVFLAVPLHATESDTSIRELDRLVIEALEHNADLRAAKARSEMFNTKVVPARSLNDPRLSFGVLNYPVDTMASDDTPMTGHDVRVEQSFPFPGKLALKGEVAEQQASWYEALYFDMRLLVAYKVRDHWYRLYSINQALELLGSNLDAVEQLIRLSETRYTVGQGLQQDVLKAQLQRSRLMDREFSLKQQKISVVAALAALLNRESLSEDDFPKELSTDLTLPDFDKAKSKLELNRPIFKAYKALIQQYLTQKRLAEKEFYPDFGMWAGYRFRDDQLPDGGEDFVSAGVSMTLPIYRAKRHAKVADAEAGLSMAREQYRQQLNQTVSELRETLALLDRTRNQVLLFESGIIPQAQQSFDAGLRAYQVGKISFKELVDSVMALHSYQIDYHRALSDYHRTKARFDQLAGIASGAEALPVENRN